MSIPDSDFDKVWSATLVQVRKTRRRRKMRRASWAGVAVIAVMAVIWWQAPAPPTSTRATARTAEPPPAAEGRIAVYRLDAAGNLRMEEVGAADIPPLEMVAALSPLVIADNADGDAGWQP